MYRWILYSKCFVLVYCIHKFILEGMHNAGIVVLVLLVYLFLNIMYSYASKGLVKNVLLLLALTLMAVCSIFIDVIFILLVPCVLFELALSISTNVVISTFISLFPILFISVANIPEYLLLFLLGALIVNLTYRAEKKVVFLSTEVDNLRQLNDTLHNRLNKSQEYERQLKYSSQLEERNSIAQMIHDKVGHAISGSLIQLQASLVILDNDSQKAKSIISNTTNILSEGMEEIRATLRNIKPQLEQIGINRLKILLKEYSTKHMIDIRINTKGNLNKITGIQWKVIYENVFEALTNSLKYSSCKNITVQIESLNKIIKCVVKDDGIGAHVIVKGLGLKGMEERSSNIGGKIITDGSNGFSVVTLLPVERSLNGN